MTILPNTVTIEQGLEDWQIFQQTDGFTDISFSGRINCDVIPDNLRVYARIVHEETMLPVVDWIPVVREGEEYRAVLSQIPAGGLYTVQVAASGSSKSPEDLRGECRKHIGVGDLYIIAGQSGATGYGRTPATDRPDPRIHLYRNSGEWDMASHPLGESGRSAHPVNADSGITGHSPWLSFARVLLRELNYPIGLLQTSCGGCAIERWNPDASEENLYSNMLAVAQQAGGAVKGVLWYQGCSDTYPGLIERYFDRFCHVVESFRRDIGENLPFLMVQSGKCGSGDDALYGMLREAQRQASHRLQNMTLVPAIDLMLSDGIHPNAAANVLLGERVAFVALGALYGLAHYPVGAPDLRRAELADGRIVMDFANVQRGLQMLDSNADATNFSFEDDKGELPISELRWDGEEIISAVPAREIVGQAYASLGALRFPRFSSPIDRVTGMPALCFYRVPIER